MEETPQGSNVNSYIGVRRASELQVMDTDVHGPYKMEWIAYAAHMAMEEKNEKDDLVLKAMRRNGFLHYRPDGEGKLVKSEEQDWCRNLETGAVELQEGP